MVGDPGIEPGVGLPGGVTVRCRTLQPVAHSDVSIRWWAGDTVLRLGRQQENGLCLDIVRGMEGQDAQVGAKSER